MPGYGCGFRFKGATPPWPYIGFGRGGLPRCWYCREPLYKREESLSFLKRELELIEERIKKMEQNEKYGFELELKGVIESEYGSSAYRFRGDHILLSLGLY